MKPFVWRDAGRTVVFGSAPTPELTAEHGVGEYVLLSTERAVAQAPSLAAGATAIQFVPGGPVPEAAAAVFAGVASVVAVDLDSNGRGGAHLVALGGGRVVDTAKAIASVIGAEVAAVPTTMSGAEMTAIHRPPSGLEAKVRGRVRPRLVLADPELMTSAPETALRASSMNALAHGVDSLATPLSNPVAEEVALRGAALIAAAFDARGDERDRAGLALGSVLCGYAIDSAGFGLHHVVCQTLVRVCGSPHAETNAAVLGHAAAVLAPRAPEPYTRLAAALGVDPPELGTRLIEIAGDPPGLGAIGAEASRRDEAAAAMLERPELDHVPGPALSAAELRAILDAAW